MRRDLFVKVDVQEAVAKALGSTSGRSFVKANEEFPFHIAWHGMCSELSQMEEIKNKVRMDAIETVESSLIKAVFSKGWSLVRFAILMLQMV